MMFEKIRELFSSQRKDEKSFIAAHRDKFLRLSLLVLCSYLAAGAVNASLLPRIMRSLVEAKPNPKNEAFVPSVALKNLPNYHAIKKNVLERNIFNQTGEFPAEESDDKKDKKESFDIEGPCEKPTAKLALLGIINIEGEKRSIATIREEGYETSDVYSEGEFIIGTDNAQIVRIQNNQVIINNAGRKECLDLKLGSDKLMQTVAAAGLGAPEASTSVEFDSKFVEGELGEGFGKIIQSARLVPNTVNNTVNGFKMFAIQPGTLLDRAGFKDNDVVTQVNKIVMEAEQGFALYQALLEEKTIKVNVLRDGKTPKTIIIKVK